MDNRCFCLQFFRCFYFTLLISINIAFGQSSNNNPARHENSKSNYSLNNIGLPRITNFSAKHYQAHPNTFAVVQDKLGIMYFGNLWGILQFDGVKWTRIPLPNGVSCTSLAIDEEGIIYAGGRNELGFLRTDSIGRKHFVSLKKHLPKHISSFSEVWRTYVTKEGILFSTNDIVFFKRKGDEKIQVVRDYLLNAFLVKDKLYLSDYSGLYIYQKGKLENLSNTSILKNKYINLVCNLQNKLLISTTEAGIFLYDGNKTEPWESPVNKVLKEFNPQKIINIHDQYLIITTELNGLFVTDIKGNILMNLNKSNGLIGNTVTNIFRDKDKNFWLTLNNGISHIQVFKEFSYINDFSGVSGIPYSSVIYNQKLYLATSEGLFYRKINQHSEEKQFSKVKEISGLVWNLQVIDGKLFCGHAITSLIIDRDKKPETIYDEGTWLFIKLKKDKILMGTYTGLHYIEKVNNQWKYSKKIKGFEESSKLVAMDRLGDVWVSHGNKGVFQLRLNPAGDSVIKANLYGVENGLKTIFNNTLAQIDNEIVISSDSGVFRYDLERERIFPFDDLNKTLKGKSGIKMIIQEPKGNLWVINKQGSLIKLKKGIDGRHDVVLRTEIFKNNWIVDFEHINPITQNTLMVGTQEGFVIYHPNHNTESNADSQFRTFITEVETLNSPELLRTGFTLSSELLKPKIPYSQNSIKFRFSCNAYEDLVNNQYSYYLEGFENTWSAWTFLPYKEYTNLNPGSYTLHVRARNFEGKIAKPAKLHFEISSPWYTTVWAIILYISLALFLTWLIIIQVKKFIIREKRRLEQEKEREMWRKQKEWESEELKREKMMMELQQEKLHAEMLALKQQELLLEQEKLQEKKIIEMQKEKFESEISFKNKELTSLTVHITQKNELLTKIRNYIRRMRQDLNDQSFLKDLNQIENLVQKGLISTREWEKFREHFDIVHEGFLKRLKQEYPDLKSTSLKLCAYLKMRLSSKQIAVLMNTAPGSVMKARYRLRVKFNLEKDEGLEEFLSNF